MNAPLNTRHDRFASILRADARHFVPIHLRAIAQASSAVRYVLPVGTPSLENA